MKKLYLVLSLLSSLSAFAGTELECSAFDVDFHHPETAKDISLFQINPGDYSGSSTNFTYQVQLNHEAQPSYWQVKLFRSDSRKLLTEATIPSAIPAGQQWTIFGRADGVGTVQISCQTK